MSEFTVAVEKGLENMVGVSTGVCPGCETCADMFANSDIEELAQGWENGSIFSEPSFSKSPCGICGSYLGGDREIWHWIDENNHIQHEDDCCVDCMLYLANGDEPEHWNE